MAARQVTMSGSRILATVVAVALLLAAVTAVSGPAGADDGRPRNLPEGSVRIPFSIVPVTSLLTLGETTPGVPRISCVLEAYAVFPRAYARMLSGAAGATLGTVYREINRVNPVTGEVEPWSQAITVSSEPVEMIHQTRPLNFNDWQIFDPGAGNMRMPASLLAGSTTYTNGFGQIGSTGAVGPCSDAILADRLQARIDILEGATLWTWGPPSVSVSASFDYTVSDTVPGQVVFTSTSSHAQDAPLTHQWSLGDGGSSTLETFTHVYTLPGSYAVGLTVTDPDGTQDAASAQVQIPAPPLSAALVLGEDGVAPLGEPFEVDLFLEAPASVGGVATVGNLEVAPVGDDVLQLPPGFEVVDAPAIPAGGVVLERGAGATTLTWTLRASVPGPFTLRSTWEGTDAADRVVGPVEATVDGEVSSGLKVEVDARVVDDAVEVTTTVTNETEQDMTGLTTTGLVVEELADDDGPLPNPLGNGVVTEDLPVTLAAGATASATATFGVVGDGLVVLVEEVTATTDDGPVSGTGAVTVGAADRDVEVRDLELAALHGVRDALRTLSAEHGAVMDEFHAELREVTGQQLTPEAQAKVDGWKQLGFSDQWAQTLAVWEGQRETFDTYVADWKRNFDGRVTDRVGSIDESVRRAGAAFLETITDLERIEAISRSLVSSGLENLGYLGDALMVPAGEGLAIAWDANTSLATGVAQDVRHAWQGARELRELNRVEWLNDPTGTARAASERHAGYAADATVDFTIGVTTEAATFGTARVLGPMVRELGHGINRAMSTQRANPLSQVSSLSDGVADALTDPMLRMARLEQALADDLARLPTGTQLPLDETLLARTGMAPDDARAFMAAIDEVNARYPQIEGGLTATFRTAEPSSAHVPGGRGKEEWNKFKAIGALDEAMGGTPLLRGQASVFDAKPLPIPIVQTLDDLYPGFAKLAEERYLTQRKNWNDYQAGTADMDLYVRASQEHGNIRIINDRPGTESFGVRYLEQLDEPGWRQASGLSDQQITQLRGQLEAHPGLQPPLAVLEQRIGDSAVGFARRYPDGTIAPDVSDFDLQYIGPASGEWPDGLRGQIITDLHQALKKHPRVPMHGASDLGFDISTELFDIVTPYMMAAYHPTSAPRVAANIEARVGRIVQDLHRRADRIEAQFPGTPLATQRAQRLRSRADQIADKVTVEWLVSHAAGEKMITITPGDIRVGGGL